MNKASRLTLMSHDNAPVTLPGASAPPAIDVLSAEKIYPNGTRALLPVDLTIRQGNLSPCSGHPAAAKVPY